MSDQITVAQVQQLIIATSLRMERLIARLSVAQMNQPGAVGIWSVKDALAHIAFWERYVTGTLQSVARGETPLLEADDETERNNASVVKQYYQRSLASVIADWQQAREDLLEQLQFIADEDLHDPARFAWNHGESLLERIAGNSYDHEQEHIDQIRAWMAKSYEL